MHWQLADRLVALDRPFILGVVNVTPDSFSDGGRFLDRAAAVAHAEQLLDEGADAVDVGGESTRPHNAGPVDAEREIARVVPVVAELVRRRPNALVSVDTVKARVADAALDAGAAIVNDVSGLRIDPEMPALLAHRRAGVIVMHSRGTVADMATYTHADYGDNPVAEVRDELSASLWRARDAGVSESAVVVDPGIGFAKRSAQSLAMLAAIPAFTTLGRPVLVGASRKRFVGELTRAAAPADRVHGSVGAHVAALMRGARLFRVHDVRAHRDALDVAWAVLEAGATEP